MKLSLRSWGGFTGPAGAVTRQVDLDELPEERRREARGLVAAAKVFEQPGKVLLTSPRSHDLNYVLEASDGPRSHRIQLHLDAANPPLRALVEWLEDAAEPVGTTPGT